MRDVLPHEVPTEPYGQEPARDRFIDLVRVWAMLVVVLLHWLSVQPMLVGGHVVDRNVVSVVPGLWPLTWVGDVMALFFFAGGCANAVSLQRTRRRRESTETYLVRRFHRLLVPTFTFLGVWLAAGLLFRVAGAGHLSPLHHVSIGNTIPFGPLWFLGVYLVVVALSPWTFAAHRRWGPLVPLAMACGVAAADAVAISGGRPTVLAVNLVLVWLIPHQLGYFYVDGSLRRVPPIGCAAMAAAGLVALTALTSLPYYPRSLVTARWQVWTMDAPTLSLVASSIWLIGLALLLRRPAERMLARERSWRVVSRANDVAMPVYLWHMTAYLVAVAVLARLGVSFAFHPEPAGAWWWGRLLVLPLAAATLLAILAALQRGTRLVRRTGSGVTP